MKRCRTKNVKTKRKGHVRQVNEHTSDDNDDMYAFSVRDNKLTKYDIRIRLQ